MNGIILILLDLLNNILKKAILNKMIIKKFTCPTYNANVWYITNCDHLECKHILEKNLNAEVESWDHEDSQGFLEVYSDPNVFVVWVKNKKDQETLVHELVHLAIEILDSRGVIINVEGSETLAYYVGYWFKILSKGSGSK